MYAGSPRCTLDSVETLSDYSGLTPLPGRHRSRLARARRNQDGLTVVLKQAAPGGAPRLEREARLLRECAGPGLVRILDFDPDRMVLVLEDLGDRSLGEMLTQAPLPLAQAIVLILRLSEATARLHQRGVLHLDLNPRNIVLAAQGEWPTLLDLGSARHATDLNAHTHQAAAAWCAPEQLDSSSRTADERADVYSLALLLWALLSGTPPFPTGRDGDLAPPPLCSLQPTLPAALDRLLRRCLDPQPEARPESARVLQAELAKLLPQPSGPRIKGLYGQENAYTVAAKALAEADRGGCAALNIQGQAGSGKSSLIQSLLELPAGRRALWARGQGQTQVGESPYSTWVQALRGALKQIGTLPEREQEILRDRMKQALGDDGGMLRGLLPEVENFVGPQPQNRPSAPTEIERVLNLLVRRLLTALARPGAPLILVLDDAHWLDPASSRLLEVMAQGGPIPGLMLVLAWRPEALTTGHPLPLTLQSVQALGPSLVVMAPLGRTDLLDLCRESLGLDLGSARALAELLLSTSQGIPARLRRSLHHLHRRKLLRYEALQGAWTWDLSRPEMLNLSTDPQALLAEDLALLAPEARLALSELAVLGQQGELPQAQALLPSLGQDAQERLAPAVAAGLLTIEQQRWRLSDPEVQEAAKAALLPEQRQALHRAIAQAYLEGGESRRFFAGVDHLNLSAGSAESEAARTHRAELNVDAAQRSRLGSAFAASLAYTIQALSAAPRTWDRERKLALHRDAASAAHLGGDQVRAEQLLSRALKHARSPIEVASLTEIQVATLLSSAQYDKAKERALAGLAGFDLSPDQPHRHPTPPQLERLPGQVPSQGLISIGRNALLARTLLLGAACDPALADWAAAVLAKLSRLEGPTAHSALAVAWIGLKIGRTRAPHLAARLAQTAEKVLALFHDPEWEALTRAFIAARIHAQVLPPDQVLEHIEVAHRLCQESAQRHAEVELGIPRAWLALRAGHALPLIERRCENDLALARRIRNRAAMDRLTLLRQLCRALQGKTRPGRLDELGFEEAELLASEHTDAQTRGMMDTASLWLAVLDDKALSARIRADSASEAWDWLGANACTPLVRCLRGIARLMGRPGTKSQGAAAGDQIWLEAAGFPVQAGLLRAELLRVRGAELEAIAAFDRALLDAESCGPALLALAGARAAAFHSGSGRTRIASSYESGRSEALLRWSGQQRPATQALKNHGLQQAFNSEGAALMELLAVQEASALEQSQLIANLRARLAQQAQDLQQQRTSDQRYRDLFGAAPDPILLTDAAGRVSDANQQARLWLGRSDLVGHPLADLLGDPRLLDHANSLLRNEGRLEALRLALPNGESRSVSATWHWSDDLSSGTTQWVFRNVQALVDAAEELEVRVRERTSQLSRSNTELESSNAELRQFATLASHDLKSPIRTVSSYLSLLRSRHSAGLSERGQDILAKALDGSVRMHELIDDMLSLSQVGQDKRPFAKVDLNAALATALENLDSEIEGAQARISAAELPLVAGNQRRLSQLFQNLISNAIKYARPSPPPQIHITAERRGGMLQVEVQDNGIGISPDDQRLVFDIFKRLHNRQKYSGNGIGLAICRKIVEMHGGNIWLEPVKQVESLEQPGTCVSFTLPLAEPD